MESAREFLVFAIVFLSAAGPCAAASPAPLMVMCDAQILATQLTINCTDVNAPNGICCEAAATAVHMPNCLCGVVDQQPFQDSNLTGAVIVSIYTICRGSPPTFDPMKGCSEPPQVGPSPLPPTVVPPAAPAPPPPTPCPQVPAPTSSFPWRTKLRDGFFVGACTIVGWLFLVGLLRVYKTMIRPNLPAWCPGALLDAVVDGLSDAAVARLDVLHPSLKREILRLAEWAKQQNAEDSTPALIIQVTELVQDLRLHLGEDPAAASTSTATTAPTSVADLLTEITRLGEIVRQEMPARV